MATKRQPDTFQLARQIYQARARHFDKADELLRSAAPEVRALVKAHEDLDEQKVHEPEPASTA